MKDKLQNVLRKPFLSSFYARDTKLVAIDLLGKVLAHQISNGVIKKKE